jgi:hypothetical protein
MGSGGVVRRALFPAFTQFFKTVQVTAYERIFLESGPGFELLSWCSQMVDNYLKCLWRNA